MFESNPKEPQSPVEQGVLKFWEDNRIFHKLLEQTKDGKPWLLLDGPVTANNRLGVHHGWGRTYKDIFQRFKAMQGRCCRWQNGFDCHGLWVEVEVEKNGWNRDEINFNMHRFVEQCESRTHHYGVIITEQSIRLGQWNHWNKSYRTDSLNNILGIWRFLKVCSEKGLLKQAYRVMPWCTRCATSLSQHEMADSYKEVQDDSIYFLCPIVGRKNESFMVWTTTPWTVPANVALAVNPNVMYSCLGTAHGKVWMSKAIYNRDYPDRKPEAECVGSELLGLQYTPFHAVQPLEEYGVIPWEKIDPNEGSGIVHIAPGCGADDYELKKANNLRAFIPVDEQGHYSTEMKCPLYEGLHWRKVNKQIIEDMRESGILVASEKVTHSYPHCWRCQEPLVFRLCREWFLLTDPIRERLKEVAAEIEWKPEYIGQHMQNWLDNMGDWCISRRRFWGLPLPFYRCCGYLTVVSSLSDLRQLAYDEDDLGNLDAMPTLHRPWIDRVRLKCQHCGKPMQRVQEVGDCWLDAGIVPFSTTKQFPNDFVCEMREQVRLWFYSTLFMSVILEDKAPYKTVMTYDEMRDAKGEKFSKTKGNAPILDKVIEEHGADVLRYVFASAPTDSMFLYGPDPLKKAKKFLNMLWNCWAFFTQNANANMPMHLGDPMNVGGVLNRWMLARLNETIREVTDALEKYDAQEAIFAIECYVDDLSTWYIRLQRPVFAEGDDGAKRVAFNVLWTSFRHLALLLAAIMPFTAEALWQRCRKYDHNMAESVHLWKWPTPLKEWAEEKELCKDMALVRDIVQMGLALRNGCKIKVRQPLHSLTIDGLQHNSLTAELDRLILQELNIEGIIYDTVELHMMTEENRGNPWGEKGVVKCTCHDLKLALNVELTDRLREKGVVREIVRAVQEGRKQAGLVIGDKIKLWLAGDLDKRNLIDKNAREIGWKCGIERIREVGNATMQEEGWVEVKLDFPNQEKLYFRIEKL